MEVRERGGAERDLPAPEAAAAAPANRAGGDASRGPPLSGTSYWLDFWLMILFDLVLFVFVYLLP